MRADEFTRLLVDLIEANVAPLGADILIDNRYDITVEFDDGDIVVIEVNDA